MSDDENLGDKTQRYESGAVTDDNSELKTFRLKSCPD